MHSRSRLGAQCGWHGLRRGTRRPKTKSSAAPAMWVARSRGLTKARPHPSISSDMNGKIMRSQERVRPRQKSGHQTLASPLKRKGYTGNTRATSRTNATRDLPKTECGRSRRSQRAVRSMSTRTRILRQDATVFGGSPQARVPALLGRPGGIKSLPRVHGNSQAHRTGRVGRQEGKGTAACRFLEHKPRQPMSERVF